MIVFLRKFGMSAGEEKVDVYRQLGVEPLHNFYLGLLHILKESISPVLCLDWIKMGSGSVIEKRQAIFQDLQNLYTLKIYC